MKKNNKGILGRLTTFVVTVFASSIPAFADQIWYVNAATGNDANDGLTEGSAFASIQKAIDSSAWGDRISVGDGIYGAVSTTNQLLAIESVNGAEKTIIDGGGTTRTANFGSGSGSSVLTNTFLRGFTVRNGYASYGGGGSTYGTLVDCRIIDSTAAMGGGSWGGVRINCVFQNNTASGEGGAMYYGIAEGCTFIDNTAKYGGAMSYTKANRCKVSGCSAYLGGAGYYVTASNSIFTANSASGGGGAAYYGDYNHCTFYGNSAEAGGVMYGGTAVNSVFWNNTADAGNDAYRADVSYSCIADIVANQGDGEGNIAANPLFINAANGDFHLRSDSPCINAGRLEATIDFSATDFDGNRRLMGGRTDMGAYETAVAGVAGIVVAPVTGGGVLPLSATIGIGESATFNAFGPRPFVGFYTNGVLAATTRSITLANLNSDVVLTAEFDLTQTGITIFASAEASDELADGDTSISAMRLQKAIDVAVSGDTIIAADGVYEPIKSSNKNVTIQSVNGASYSIIDGGGTNRCATFVGQAERIPADRYATKLIGFTIRNGKGDTKAGWSPWYGNGGGCQGGTLINCRIVGNSDTFGGGAYCSVLVNCLVETNSATQGGGLYNCMATNCAIRGNYASAHGGGTGGGGSYVECVIEDNVSDFWGGGGSDPNAVRCIYRRNRATNNGGGVSGGMLHNCLVVDNTAKYGGGGYSSVDGTLVVVNCTVWGNSAETSGGGFYAPVYRNDAGASQYCEPVAVNNSIVYGNHLSDGTTSNYSTYNDSNVSIVFNGSCSTPLPTGECNIDSDPKFIDEWSGDFRLQIDSPCVNAGLDNAITVDCYSFYDEYDEECFSFRSSMVIDDSEPDLARNTRRMFGAMDMGAYECQEEPPHVVTYADIWGEWSNEGDESYSVPESVATWEELSRVLWQSRDAYVKGGANTEVPPSEGSIVLSLGAVKVPDSLMASEENIAAEMENDVSVWRLRVYEDTETASLVAVVGKSAFALSSVPVYLGNSWIEAVYGAPPTWLNVDDREKWYAERSRSRIEWFVTLVPQSQWGTFCANRAKAVADAEKNGESPLVINSVASDAVTGIHRISVRSFADGETRIWGKDSLSETNWTYKGFSLQAAGTTAAGAHSVSNQLFMMATFSDVSCDSDGDGIPDVVEEKVYGTNPYKADSSGDGLSDWEKSYRYDLNPRVRDTSNDGIDDDEKIASGADPRVAVSVAEQQKAKMSIRYYYDDDDRLTGTWFGTGGGSTKTTLTTAGNPSEVRRRNSER